MVESFSTVTLLGALRQPVRLETTPSGTPHGVFEVLLRAQAARGQWFTTKVPFWVLMPDRTGWREGKERLSRTGSIPVTME